MEQKRRKGLYAGKSRQGTYWSKYRCKCRASSKEMCVCSSNTLEIEREINGSTFRFCHCKLSYNECLKSRDIDLKENKEEMKKQEARNLMGLFSKSSPSRIRNVHITSFNTWVSGNGYQKFEGLDGLIYG